MRETGNTFLNTYDMHMSLKETLTRSGRRSGRRASCCYVQIDARRDLVL